MKKFIALAIAMLLIFTLSVPASAATTMHWDWGKAMKSIGNATADLVQEDQQVESTEIPETEYNIPTESPESHAEIEQEPVAEIVHKREQGWRDWLRRWSWCVEGWK